MAFQDDLTRALAKTADSRGIAETATALASAIESRLGSNSPGLAGAHAAIVAVVVFAAKYAPAITVTQEATAAFLAQQAAMSAELQALRAASEAQAIEISTFKAAQAMSAPLTPAK
jgi:hypothetical protein